MTERWREVFRTGLVPLLSRETLARLRTALAADDDTILQGDTAHSDHWGCDDEECCGACLLAWCGWTQGATLGEVEEAFSTLCYRVDCAFGDPGAVQSLVRWWDESPRDFARAELLAELALCLDAPAVDWEGAP